MNATAGGHHRTAAHAQTATATMTVVTVVTDRATGAVTMTRGEMSVDLGEVDMAIGSLTTEVCQ